MSKTSRDNKDKAKDSKARDSKAKDPIRANVVVEVPSRPGDRGADHVRSRLCFSWMITRLPLSLDR